MEIVKDSNNPETRAVKLETYKEESAKPSSEDGPFLGFDVSRAVENLRCLNETGDIKQIGSKDEFFVSIEEQTGPSGEKIEYLRYDPVRNLEPQYMLWQDDDDDDGGDELPYFLAVPTRFVKPGSDSPFAGYTNGDKINVEIDFLNNLIRVYRVEDYYLRYGDLLTDETPPYFKGVAAIPLSTVIQQRAPQDSEQSQKQVEEFDIFEIRPFNPLKRNVLETVEKHSKEYSKTFDHSGRTEVHIGLIHDFINQLQPETEIRSRITVNYRNDQHTVEDVSVQGSASYELYIPRQGTTTVEVQSPIGDNKIEFAWKPTITTDADWGITVTGAMNGEIDFVFKEDDKHIVYVPVPKKIDVAAQKEILGKDLSNTSTDILGTSFEWSGIQVIK